jgi:hypothetical protein
MKIRLPMKNLMMIQNFKVIDLFDFAVTENDRKDDDEPEDDEPPLSAYMSKNSTQGLSKKWDPKEVE